MRGEGAPVWCWFGIRQRQKGPGAPYSFTGFSRRGHRGKIDGLAADIAEVKKAVCGAGTKGAS